MAKRNRMYAPKTLAEAQQYAREDWAGLSEEEKKAAGGYWSPTGWESGGGDPSRAVQREWIPYSASAGGGAGAQGDTGRWGQKNKFYGFTDFEGLQKSLFQEQMAMLGPEFANLGTLSSSAYAHAAVGAAAQAQRTRYSLEVSEKTRLTDWEQRMQFGRWAQDISQQGIRQGWGGQDLGWAQLQQQQQQFESSQNQYFYRQGLAALAPYDFASVVGNHMNAFSLSQMPTPFQRANREQENPEQIAGAGLASKIGSDIG